MKIWKETPGIISEGKCWCAAYGCWLHIEDSLFKLIINVIKEYKHDKHMVG